MAQRVWRLLASFVAVVTVTFIGFRLIHVNATTEGFAYLLLILVIASTWGFLEAAFASLFATLVLNFFFFPPVGTFTIDDPQNWVALSSFLVTSLIASQLSTKARKQAVEALERQQDIQRLYTFSRALLLSDRGEPFQQQLVRKLAESFGFTATVLYDRRAAEFHRAGPSDFEGFDDQVRDAALRGTSFADATALRTVFAVRLGSEPIASLALQGVRMPDAVLQGVTNIVAIGLERARAEEMAHKVEAERQGAQLMTALIDAMAHEFKTPLTLIRGATTSVLAGDDPLSESTRDQLTIADEQAEHLGELLDDTIEMVRHDKQHINIYHELSDLQSLVDDVIRSMRTQAAGRKLQTSADENVPLIPLDRRLVKLAIKQLVDNALKYSPADSQISIQIRANGRFVNVDITDHGAGISDDDQKRIFEKFFRGGAIRTQIPGFGLGLSIAQSIIDAHHGDLTLTSQPGETTFRMTLPIDQAEDHTVQRRSFSGRQ